MFIWRQWIFKVAFLTQYNALFKFVSIQKDEISNIYKERSQLLLDTYKNHPALVSNKTGIVLDCTCSVSFILEKLLPSPITETRTCHNCMPKLRPSFYVPLKNVFKFNQRSMSDLQNSVDFDTSYCNTCNTEQIKNFYTNYGIAIVDVMPTNNVYSIKISEITPTINLLGEELHLRGIIHFEPMKLKNMNGHFRSYIKRNNNTWEMHDDLLHFSVEISSSSKINPAILIYSKY